MIRHFDKNDANETFEKDPTHEGLVLAVGSDEVRVMSDIWGTEHYALVWDPTKGEPERIRLYVDSDMGSGFQYATATVDATDEVVAAYGAWKAEKARQEAEDRARAEWDEPKPGKYMKVVRGRKVKPGTIGHVFWIGHYPQVVGFRGYRPVAAPTRIGLALDDERDENTGRYLHVVFVEARHCENYKPFPGLDAVAA